MSVLFNDARFDTRARPRSRATTGLWLSVVAHATLSGVLLAVVPTQASGESSTSPRLPAPPAPSRPVREAAIAEVPKPLVVTPTAAKPVEPAAAIVPPAPTFERPIETAAIELPPVTAGVFERSNSPRTSQGVAAVTTGGFGSVAPTREAANGADDVRAGRFDRRASAPVQSAGAAAPRPIDRPVEIVFKPAPEYTDDARSARIEGTVTLELEFTAAGEVRVLRVVRGLGHGLDEAAQRAALRIRFKPAQSSDGRAVDSRATVFITFRLS
jgi:TonB family protein